MKKDMLTIHKLQDVINHRLKQFAGRKYDSRKRGGSNYHDWYHSEIAATFEEYGITIFRPSTRNIVADIEELGPLKVSYENVAEIKIDVKRDRRYSCGGPGTVLSMSVHFREDLLNLTIPAVRVRLLEEDKENRLAYYRDERKEALAAAEEAAAKIAELEAVEIVEVDA